VRRLRLITLLSLLLLLGMPVRAQDDEQDDARETNDEALAAYDKALKAQRKGRWKSAKRAFRRFIKRYPESPLVEDARERSGDNAYLGCEILWKSGPASRRIDVAVMGDGFTIDASDQNRLGKWAELCIDVLWHEKGFGHYKNYFNVYFVRLASLEEGVDPNLSPEEIEKKRKKNKQRRRALNYKIDYSTALDAKAAGPQGQVMMNRGLVYKWLEIAHKKVPGAGDDRLVIAFAQFGKLGMGGGGIAHVGRPDKSITTHEFGHAFVGLLDEYQGNPNPPPPGGRRWVESAANATYTGATKKVPWAHFLKKKVKGVGVYEGGATYNKGVWRPARTCAMNAAGATAFCPVCREAAILVIYEYVRPIDTYAPGTETEIKALQGDDSKITVTPMQPKKPLKVRWYVAVREPEDPGVDDLTIEEDPEQWPPMYAGRGGRGFGGKRANADRSEYDEPPPGELNKLAKRLKGKPRRYAFPLGKLPPGLYTITVEVKDETKFVIKDPKHLLEDRQTWQVRVDPKPKR